VAPNLCETQLQTGAPYVHARAMAGPQRLLLEVADTRIGTGPAERVRLFQPFVTARRVAGRPPDGGPLGHASSVGTVMVCDDNASPTLMMKMLHRWPGQERADAARRDHAASCRSRSCSTS
jgi:hypothetical protein